MIHRILTKKALSIDKIDRQLTDGNIAECYYFLGLFDIMISKDFKSAILNFKEALHLEKNNLGVLSDLSNAYHQTGDYQASFNTALKAPIYCLTLSI